MLCFCSATLAFPGEPSPALPCPDQILAHGCEGSPKLHQGQLLAASGLGMDGVPLHSQQVPTRSRGGTRHHFWQGIIPSMGAGSAGVSCLPHSDSTGHCAVPPPQQEYRPHTWMTPSLCQRAQQAASLLQLCCTDPLIPFPRASLSCLLILWFLPAGITSETLWRVVRVENLDKTYGWTSPPIPKAFFTP